MNRLTYVFAFALVVCLPAAAAVTGAVRGMVEDPNHRRIGGAEVAMKSVSSDYSRKLTAKPDGSFELTAIPVGVYQLTVSADGFISKSQRVTVPSGGVVDARFELPIAAGKSEVTVTESSATNAPQITPETIVSREDIAAAPGADLPNSLSSITTFVPGSWVTHDQLHVRGGHQVTWAIDGVPIPNTNIASNVGPQIDPKDIDYLEAERGGYSAAYGDRTYGVFNAIPRTGFEGTNFGEFSATYGTFHQTSEHLSFGSHTDKFAYFGSLSGNRSDSGLETPGPEVLHDRVWGVGGMATLVYNRDPANQFRLVTSLRHDDYQVPDTDDVERERDGLVSLSWLHTMRQGLLLTVSPFYHDNQANYDGGPMDPIQTTQHRNSQYAGAQVSLNAVTARHNATVGVFGFFQHDDESVSLMSEDASVAQKQPSNGHLAAVFLEDQFKAFSWLTLTAGVRLTHFSGAISENAATPRLGAAVKIPRVNWTLHGFWGKYYQAPPLSTVSGPLLDFAVSQGLGFIPLHGERDHEYQFGLTIPMRGWSFDVNRYDQRARNYFDHNAIGNSNVFFPLTIDRAHLRGTEVSVRSPQLFRRRLEAHLAYAYARAEAAGAVSGGLTSFSPPESGYFLLDHDQRHTLHTGFSARLPWGIATSWNVAYGSGFTDGSSDVPAHLPGHATFDGSIAKTFAENVTVSVVGLNAANRRFLLDNSETFGGTHYADPREIYVQVRYKFHY